MVFHAFGEPGTLTRAFGGGKFGRGKRRCIGDLKASTEYTEDVSPCLFIGERASSQLLPTKLHAERAASSEIGLFDSKPNLFTVIVLVT